MNIRMWLLALGVLGAAACFAQSAAEADLGWPVTVTGDDAKIEIYQPQVDSWKGNQLKARTAITLTRDATQRPVYGIASISARTHVDKESRVVTLDNVKIESATFPSSTVEESELLQTLRDTLSQWPQTMSLDRLQASMAIAQAESATESAPLKNDPPRIIFSGEPAVLVVVDGDPVYRSVAGSAYSRVINTPALILSDAVQARLYLDGGTIWMTATTLAGPWTLAANAPPELDAIRAGLAKQEDVQPDDGHAVSSAVPRVYVSTSPAELLQTQGSPRFSPIPKTTLLYVSNSDNDIFMDVKSQQYFTLLAGRWFAARSLDGPWHWVAAADLPGDFARIPAGSPKAGVLASVPGTVQARDAVAQSQIPQTAAVSRAEAKLTVNYDGFPVFKPIDGTSLEYAANADTDVVRSGETYYACSQAIWFVGSSPSGPWAVADTVPPAIYAIPPSSPLYHVRNVHIYDSTPDTVYVGYTPGYLGSYLSDGVVVFGTGWSYPSWIGDVYYGCPWTWGLGFDLGFWGGEWFWGAPVGYHWWYHDWRGTHRIYAEHWHPGWRGPGSVWAHNNVNVYHRWGGNAIRRNPAAVGGFAERRAVPSTIRGRQQGRAAGHDMYAGKDGSVYDRRNNAWYRQNGQGWNRVQRPAPDVNREQQSRSFGAARPNTIGRPAAGGGVFRGGGFPAGGGFHGGGVVQGGGGFHGGGGRR